MSETYEFRVVLAGVNEITVALEDAVFEAGCDDAFLHSLNGVVMVDFERQAGNLGVAICGAVQDVMKAGYKVARVEVGEPAATA